MKICSVCQRCFEDSVLSCSEENHLSLTEGRVGSCASVANYRLEFLHESTAAGETYRALNTILKKPYLIKIIAPELFNGAPELKETFLREARDLAAIIHPNVARVFESGVLADGSIYVVTELLTAQTLRNCLTNVGKPTEVTTLTLTRQAAEGLEAIHAAGALHRNLNPENIILTTDEEKRFLVKLQNIDFGGINRKVVNSAPEQNLNYLRYFSPEQCAGKRIDAQTDVYALGTVLYEALAGRPPFDMNDADILINKQLNEPPPPVNIHNFDIRMLLTHTLTDALQKTKRLRLKTATALVRRLRHIEQLATHSPTPPPAVAYPAAMDKAAIVFTPPAKNETETAFENPAPVEIETATETIEPAVKPFLDLTTTKLPPIESIVGNGLSGNASSPPLYETAENSKIQTTNEAVLIEWEQPDDIPSIAEIPGKKKVVAAAAGDSPVFLAGDDDSIIDMGDADASPETVSEVDEMRQPYAPEPALFSYHDSGMSWNLPDKRKLLTGAGLVALFVLAVGGTLLSRQFQLARDARQTTAQSSPNSKSLPKPVDLEKVAETDRPAPVKSETLPVSNPAQTADNPETIDLPDYQPREISEKTDVPQAPTRNKKRGLRDLSENRDDSLPNKTVSGETSSVTNKKAETKTGPRNKNGEVKSQVSTSAKPDVLTRPRIVKNPKF